MGVGISYASQGIGGLIYIDHDTDTTIASSVAETTLGTLTIPANLLKNQAIISAAIHMSNTAGIAGSTTFRLYTGPTGTEVLRQTVILTGANGSRIGGLLHWVDAVMNFTVENTVLITAQNDVNGANFVGRCVQCSAVGN